MEEGEQDFKLTPKDKKYLMMALAAICIIVILVGTYKLVQVKACKDKEGIYMEDKSCYIPKSEEERQQIIEQGYVKTGFDITDTILTNMSLEKKFRR